MRSCLALLLTMSGCFASTAVAQVDVPPPSRLVRRLSLDLPSPSRPIGRVETSQNATTDSFQQVQYSEPVLAPPATEPSADQQKTPPAFPVGAPSPGSVPDSKNEVPVLEIPTQVGNAERLLPVEPPQLYKPDVPVPQFQDSVWTPVNSNESMAPPPPEPGFADEGPTTFAESPAAVPPLSCLSRPLLDTQTLLEWPENERTTAERTNIYSPEPRPYVESDVEDWMDWQPEIQIHDGFQECQCEVCSGEFQVMSDSEIAPAFSIGFKGGNDRSLLDIGAMLPLWQSDLDLLFGDLRGRFDDQEASEGQFGIGFRTMVHPEWIFGAYSYYDLRKTRQRNRFNQLTAGLELMSEEWDVRLNGYFPNEGGKPSGFSQGISNGTIVSNAFQERAYRGFNVEVGKRILHWGRFDTSEVRWFASYYSFDSDASGFRSIAGPATRIEYRNYDLPWLSEQSRLTAGVEYSWDNVRDDQYWAYVRLQVPFSPKEGLQRLNSLRRRFLDLPSRSVD